MSTTDHGLEILDAQNCPDIWGFSPIARLHKQIEKTKIKPSGRMILRGDVVYDDAVLRGMADNHAVLLLDNDGNRLGAHVSKDLEIQTRAWMTGQGDAPLGPEALTPAKAGGNYNHMLRKRSDAQCHIITKDNAQDIEWLLYLASYKGVTDLVTKYVWPVPAYHATRFCTKMGFSPNMVTTAGFILTLLTFMLFWEGHFALGLIAGWIMTFLDTVDGKLARVTLTSSKWGNVFDHGIDLLHPPFWYWAWGVGLAAGGYIVPEHLNTWIWVIVASYIGGRIVEGYFMRRFGFHIHVWRKFDSFFRLIVARRNPNMIFLTLSLIMGRPDLGFLAVALWTFISVPVHIVQSVQAEMTKARGGAVKSWLSA